MQLSSTDLGLLFAGLTTLVLFVGGVMGILVGLKKLTARNPDAEPVTRSEMIRMETYLHATFHAIRNDLQKVILDTALVAKTVDNGIKNRITTLEEHMNRIAERP